MKVKSDSMSKFIRMKRIELKMSQGELSKSIGWSSNPQYVSNIERGLCPFPIKWVLSLSKALWVSPYDLADLMSQDYKNSLMKVIIDEKYEKNKGV